MTAAQVLLFAVAWIGPGHVEDLPTPMDPNALYAALNTIAQCAAALAALIGFLVFAKLEWLKKESEQLETLLEEWIIGEYRPKIDGLDMELAYEIDSPVKDMDITVLHRHKLLWQAKRLAENRERFWGFNQDNGERGTWWSSSAIRGHRMLGARIWAMIDRLEILPREQKRLMWGFSIFLAVTLVVIFVPAIIGIIHADRLKTWVGTPWLIYVASAWLGLASAYIVWQVVHSTRTLTILTLLAMASPALADPGRCTSSYEAAMDRWQTVCPDGTRSTSTWSTALRQWQTAVTPPPGPVSGKTPAGRVNPRTR